VLAARITELLAMGDHPQSLSPEQQAQWAHVKAPFSLMYTRYNISRVYHTWRRHPEDAGARQAFQSTLLGADHRCRVVDKFNTAPPPRARLDRSDEETPLPAPRPLLGPGRPLNRSPAAYRRRRPRTRTARRTTA
jgi:hypothetical protein